MHPVLNFEWHNSDISAGLPRMNPVGRFLNGAALVCIWLFFFAVPWEEEVDFGPGMAASHWIGWLAFAMAGLSVAANRRLQRPTTAHYLLMAWTGWAALSYLWSVDPDSTATRIFTFLQLLAMAWLVWEIAPTRGRQIALLNAFVLGTCVSSLSTIHSFVQGQSIGLAAAAPDQARIAEEMRYAAQGFNANELGLMLAISLPMSCYLLAQRRKVPVGLFYWIQLALAVTSILLTGSRGALMAAAVALVMFLVALPTFPGWQKFAALVLLPVAVTGVAMFVPSTVLERFTTIGSELTQGTFTKRTIIWAAGLDVFREHAVAGVGAGAFGESVLSRLDIPYAAHNTFLSILVEEGVVGEAIFLMLLLSLFVGARRMPRLERGMWTILLLTWIVGVCSTTWEQRKPTWFLFGMLAAQIGMMQRKKTVTLPDWNWQEGVVPIYVEVPGPIR